ncbi:hypothetical protein E3G42_003327 [Mycobacteroides abscessus]|nr:hypothetical protein [Mycobacteroides abscessus]QOF25046.1 hypothetical protein E3G42_003327 [Mycobacteroides abscessus]SHR57825.1 Uncharacterised protein [Mycobacteroides abscessus subsp. abscessus]SKY53477.1 Uncharacterised protein [Mycobacteroides abscessus subsp. bolletii]
MESLLAFLGGFIGVFALVIAFRSPLHRRYR